MPAWWRRGVHTSSTATHSKHSKCSGKPTLRSPDVAQPETLNRQRAVDYVPAANQLDHPAHLLAAALAVDGFSRCLAATAAHHEQDVNLPQVCARWVMGRERLRRRGRWAAQQVPPTTERQLPPNTDRMQGLRSGLLGLVDRAATEGSANATATTSRSRKRSMLMPMPAGAWLQAATSGDRSLTQALDDLRHVGQPARGAQDGAALQMDLLNHAAWGEKNGTGGQPIAGPGTGTRVVSIFNWQSVGKAAAQHVRAVVLIAAAQPAKCSPAQPASQPAKPASHAAQPASQQRQHRQAAA